MRKYSYESILSAVGRVLDSAEARSFAIRDEENGLLVETFDSSGKPGLTLNFDVADLASLIDDNTPITETDDSSRYDLTYAPEESTLRRLLNRRELVGAGR
jgi:hypothetical protein